MNLAKEECLAERVAITMLKADNNQTMSQGSAAQKKQHEIFTQNEFSKSHNLIKEIV